MENKKLTKEEQLKQYKEGLKTYQQIADTLFPYCQLYQEKLMQIKSLKELIEKLENENKESKKD